MEWNGSFFTMPAGQQLPMYSSPEDLSSHSTSTTTIPTVLLTPGDRQALSGNRFTDLNLDGLLAQEGEPNASKSPKDDESYKARRKEQNRLAQKAFRDRKQQYITVLENKINQLEQQNQLLERDNMQLRQDIAALLPLAETSDEDVLSSPLVSEVPRASWSSVDRGLAPWPAHLQMVRISRASREKLLDVQNTCELIQTIWGLIQSHELFEKGIINVGNVYDRLREIALSKGDKFYLNDGINEILQENAAKNEDFLL